VRGPSADPDDGNKRIGVQEAKRYFLENLLASLSLGLLLLCFGYR